MNLRVLVLVLLLSSLLFIQLPLPAHASGPTVVQSSWGYASGATGHCGTGINGFPNKVTAGDVLVLAIKSGFPISTVSDNQSNSYSSQVSTSRGDGDYQSSIWSASNAVTHFVQMTVTLTNGGSDMGLECYELSGVEATALSTAVDTFCQSSCPTALQTTTSIAATGKVAIGTYLSVGSAVFNAGASFTKICSANANSCGPYDGEYSTTISGNTNFPATVAANAPQSGAAAVFGISPTVTVIAPCTFYQLQCWWFPILFMGSYTGIILLVAAMLGTTPRGKAHIFLSALTMGSLVGVIFGVMNIVVPLVLLILNTIIALRLRG